MNAFVTVDSKNSMAHVLTLTNVNESITAIPMQTASTLKAGTTANVMVGTVVTVLTATTLMNVHPAHVMAMLPALTV
jgi:hypothetical protein